MTTPIRGIDALSAADALAAVRAVSPHDVWPGDTTVYVQEMHRLCRQFGLRLRVLLAQALHETGNFGPAGRWSELNPAGLGITTGSDPTPYWIIDGTEAAQIHVWSMLVALREESNAGRILLPLAAREWQLRWVAKYRDPNCPAVNHVEDLNQIYAGNRATWATDPLYGEKLLRTMRNVFGEEQPAMGDIVFGRVPHPVFQDRPIATREGAGQNDLGKRAVKGVVWHRIVGSLWGTDSYFRRPDVNALTDYGVGVLAQDGAASDGLILRWNDPLGRQSGWASGKVIAPYGDGKKFVDRYGVNAVNRDQVSIEISGFYQTPVSAAARDAVVALTAYWADQYRIPWDTFPIAPHDGFSFVRWHNEFTGMSEKECPGSVVMVATDDWIGRTKALLKHYQEAAAGPETPLPVPSPLPVNSYPSGMSPELAARFYGTVTVPWSSKPFAFDLNRSECRFWLAYGSAGIPEGGDYRDGNFAPLTAVIRRGNQGDAGRVFQWANGAVYFQEPPDRQRGPV